MISSRRMRGRASGTSQIELETWRDRSLWQRTKELGSYFIRYRL